MRIFRLGNRGRPSWEGDFNIPYQRPALPWVDYVAVFPFGVIWIRFLEGKYIYIWMIFLNQLHQKPTMILLPIWTFSPPLKRYVVLPTLLIYCRLYALFMLYNVVQVKTLKHRQVSFIPNQAFMESYGQNWSDQFKKNRRAHIPKELDRFW